MDCVPVLMSMIEERLGRALKDEPSRCSVCDQLGPVLGVSIQVGNDLLRGVICSICEAFDDLEIEDSDLKEAPHLQDLRVFGLRPIQIGGREIEDASNLEAFDEVMLLLLRRGEALAEVVIESVDRSLNEEGRGLTLNEAAIGGCLVRISKLLRGIIDSVKADASESHSPLSRCLAETTITLRWLVRKDSEKYFRIFRAASFSQWDYWVEESKTGNFSEDELKFRLKVDAQIARELEAADLTWDDIPKRSNWDPDVRQRFQAFDQDWAYLTLFKAHSNYIHPSWHELRSFHLKTESVGTRLDQTYADMAPPTAFVLAQLVAEAALDAATYLSTDLDLDAFCRVSEGTVKAARETTLRRHDESRGSR